MQSMLSLIDHSPLHIERVAIQHEDERVGRNAKLIYKNRVSALMLRGWIDMDSLIPAAAAAERLNQAVASSRREVEPLDRHQPT
ncbi:hypothetical protein PsorP6_007942 [Peronosclerospora sorghi]|uniref:Uncharacterized protein n=1 Tax=Peronosclerospora sorghi TaxID=230839 RepID=A0ACC0WAP6_9STRA|nr:hypothetical protein PsorP6_007942 [Peronosclerospora sorghi]